MVHTCPLCNGLPLLRYRYPLSRTSRDYPYFLSGRALITTGTIHFEYGGGSPVNMEYFSATEIFYLWAVELERYAALF